MGELIIAKNRAGSLDTVQLRFIGKYTKYCDLDATDYSSFTGGDSLQSFAAVPDTMATFEGGARTVGSKMNNFQSGGGEMPSFGTTPPNQDVPF
jgi:replicative DNA helicase